MWFTAIASLIGNAAAPTPLQNTGVPQVSTSPVVYIAGAAALVGVGALIYLAVKS